MVPIAVLAQRRDPVVARAAKDPVVAAQAVMVPEAINRIGLCG